MAAEVYMKSFTLGAPDFVALAEQRLILSGTLIAAASNGADVSVRASGITASWPPGTQAELRGVDLSTIEIKGAANDQFLVVAHSR